MENPIAVIRRFYLQAARRGTLVLLIGLGFSTSAPASLNEDTDSSEVQSMAAKNPSLATSGSSVWPQPSLAARGSGVRLQSSLTTRGCFKKHIEDAMVINRARRPLYMQLSQGRSAEVSNRLLFLEQLSLYGAWFMGFDREARPYQAAGIPILCLDFIDMADTPLFQESLPMPWPVLADFQKQDAWSLKRRLQKALNGGGFEALSHVLEVELHRLEPVLGFHCMLRHTLESMLRISNLAPKYVDLAEERGLPSTEPLSRRVIEGHFKMLVDIVDLDESAAPLQAQGLPIICQDVPHIPAHADL